jgi:flagellin-specific chaperone FliS
VIPNLIPVIEEQLREKDKEIERLNNIINELEKELKDRIKNVPDTMAEVYEDKSILHKLQELKGDCSNE